ncbi:MAG: FKBP-type peptidyl-prolyl cis-trans isomerase [Robiginitomaculum sp.]|nr:FKBP-type peptidyl-prolyl cis-trans isomerase [Robiginitomaculum sp.]
MNKFLLAGLSAALLGLGACNNATPTTEDAAVEAVKVATETLAKFRTCPEANVLKDISSYDSDFGDATLDQDAWFAANGKKPGVTTTASGLQYRVNKASAMKSNTPKPEQTVRVNYHGLFLDGKTFDSSYDRGQDIEFPLNRVIPGWTEGVGLMKPCDAWTFYIPSDLAYGDSGKGSIPAKTPLVFHVQLLGVR